MRYAALLLIAALAAAGIALPAPEELAPGPAVGSEEPAVAVCSIQEGSGRSTNVSILSTVNGPTQLTLFTAGESAGTLSTSTGSSGSTVLPVGDVAAVGTVGGLVELPNPSSTAGVVIRGATSLMAEACASIPHPQVFVTGGSTVSGESFSLQLMNPYAGEAIVSLRVTSEAGVESNDRFSSVVIPPQSSETIPFSELIPGRERVSVAVDTVEGRVIAVAQQGIEGESSIWNAVPADQDWFLPIPQGQPSRTLLIATPSAIDVEYQIDFYGPDGLEEALITGVLPAGGQAEVDIDEISQGTSAMRVIATSPVVPTLRIASADGFATTNASPVQANRWMLPGASALEDGWANAVVLNASIEESTVSIRPLREDSAVRDIALPSDQIVELALEMADGYLIESTSPVVVMWTGRSASAASAAMGVPLPDE
jgi:hypothetical protein